MKLLLVEDSTPLRGIVKQMLEQLGYKDVAEAGDGEEAWQQLRKERFDLLLTDWNMPRMSGLELLKRVRQDREMADLPVVMLTTRNNREDIISAVKAGISNYVTKPCKASQLKEKIDKAVLQQVEKRTKAKEVGERAIQGCRKYHPAQKSSYVLFYEKKEDVEGLNQGLDADLAHFYEIVLTTLDKMNHPYPGLDLGYEIEYDTKEVTRRVKADPMVRVVLISGRHSEGMSLARMITFGQEGVVPVHLLCESIATLEMEQRDGLAKLGVQFIERHQFSTERAIELLAPLLMPPVVKTDQGLTYIELEPGSGFEPTAGQTVTLHYVGMLADGKVFHSTARQHQPVSFVLGKSEVIAGWDQGVARMRKGCRALLIVPPELGFGAEGDGKAIPPHATLSFRMELIDIADPPPEEKPPAAKDAAKR